MEDYSLNLVDLVQRHVSGDFVGKMSSLLGESKDRTRAGFNGAVPGLLAGFDEVASTGDGARRLSSAVDNADQGVLADIGRMLGKDSRSSIDRGSGVLQSIMGSGGLSDLAARVGGSSGLSGRAVSSLLGLLAPIVLGVLKREKHSRGLDSMGLSELLASQRSNITAAMPENMLGRGEPLREVARETHRAPRTGRIETYTGKAEPVRHSWLSWVLPLALLAGLIGLVWNLASRPPKTAVLPSATVHAGREPVQDAPKLSTAASLESLRSKYQSVINEAQSQGVQISNMHAQNGKLVIKGTAPSAAAVTSVWNEIRRVNPRQDDIIADFRVDASMAPPSSAPADSGMPGIPAVPQSDNGGFADTGDRTYTVKAGDTLGTISSQFYGTSGEYMRIFDANRDQLTDRDMIEIGQQLTIP